MYRAVTQIELNNFLLANSIDDDRDTRDLLKAPERYFKHLFREESKEGDET